MTGTERDNAGTGEPQHIADLSKIDVRESMIRLGKDLAVQVSGENAQAWRPLTYPTLETFSASCEMPSELSVKRGMWRAHVDWTLQANRSRATTLMQSALTLMSAGIPEAEVLWSWLVDEWSLPAMSQRPGRLLSCTERAAELCPAPTWLPGYYRERE